MPATAAFLPMLHLALLSAFVGIASLSMLLTLISHMRVRRMLLSWRCGRCWGVPLGPACFLLVALGGLGYALAQGYAVRPGVLVGYPAGGAFWLVAAYLARSIIVTEYGIIHDVNRISQAVAWGQIVDYFTVDVKHGVRYVFFYTENDRRQRYRLEVTVPSAHVEAFQRVVESKLKARFAFSVKETPDQKTFEE